MVAVVAAPLVASAVHALVAGGDYLPAQDRALIELRTRDVFDHLVDVGPYSRFRWNHPGGLMFYVLALPYRLLGSRSSALDAGAAALNASVVALVGWIGFRRGGLATAAAVLLPVALLVRALGISVLTDPWNPHLPILVFLAFVLLCWSVVVGDLWMTPLLVLTASFCVQTHVGFAIEVVLLGAFVLAAWTTRFVRDAGDRSRLLRIAGVSAAVGLVLWGPVLVAHFAGRSRNLQAIVSFFRDSSEPGAGLGSALEVVGAQWGARPDWIFGARPARFLGLVGLDHRWWLAAGIVLAAAATLVARYRRDASTMWLAVVAAAAVIAGIISVGSVVGPLYPYIVRWTWALGAVLGILVLQGAWLAVPPTRRPAVARWARPGVLVVLTGLAVSTGVPLADRTSHDSRAQAVVRRLTDQTIAALPDGEGPVRLLLTRPALYAAGIALQLERRGIPVSVETEEGYLFGRERAARAGPYRATLSFLGGRQEQPPGRLIARWSRPASQAQRRALRRLVDDYVRDMGRPLTPAERRFATLKGEDLSIYLVDETRAGRAEPPCCEE